MAFVYAPDRKGERPAAHLAGFAGVLQVDGYAGYAGLAAGGAVTLAYCWAHARRSFYEIHAGSPAPIAAEALARIAKLYEIEAEIRGRPAEERCRGPAGARRADPGGAQALARRPSSRRCRGKSAIAEAIRYVLAPLGRARPLPRRRPDRDRQQHRRADDARRGDEAFIVPPFVK